MCKCAKYIAIWLLLSASPVVLTVLHRVRITPGVVLEWGYGVLVLISVVGLFIHKNWGRRLAVGLLSGYFLWALYSVITRIGPGYSMICEWFSEVFQLNPDHVRPVLLVLMIIYLLSPVFFILYLTHPRIGDIFVRGAQEDED